MFDPKIGLILMFDSNNNNKLSGPWKLSEDWFLIMLSRAIWALFSNILME